MNDSELRGALDAACRRHDVPGASAAIFFDGRTHVAASGVANCETGIDVTPDTLMHIGSITKVFNATLLMQLVDEGRVFLDRRVVEYLRDFRVRDAEATASMTVEMLLDHTAGIDGDLLPDAGHDRETLAETMARFAECGQIHAPGEGRSYCNPGTVIAGFLSSALSNKGWHQLIRERLFEPLELLHASVLPEDAILSRTSVGHFKGPHGNVRRTSHAFLPLGYAPAGSTAMMSAEDLLTFARMHVDDGVASNGARVLSAQSAARMRVRSGPSRGPEPFSSGLGWRLSGDVILHGGGGPGIVSMLVAHPPSRSAAAVLTNAEYGSAVIADVIGPLFKEKLGIELFPKMPEPVSASVDPSPYVGRYESINTVHEVELQPGGVLTWASWSTQKYYDSSPMTKPPPTPLVPIGKDAFRADSRVSTMPASDIAIVSFSDAGENGQMKFLGESLWLFPRREPA